MNIEINMQFSKHNLKLFQAKTTTQQFSIELGPWELELSLDCSLRSDLSTGEQAEGSYFYDVRSGRERGSQMK